MSRTRLEQLARCWRQQLIVRDVLFALAVANAFFLLALSRPVLFHWQIPLLTLVATLGARLAASRPWRLDARRLARHLDRTHPELEESTALFLRAPEQLNLLEHLQQSRVSRALSARTALAPSFGEPPRDFLRAACLCLALAAFSAGLGAILLSRIAASSVPPASARTLPNSTPPPAPATLFPPKILANTFTIIPPAYTARPPRRVEGFTAEAEEGATVTWDLALDRPVRAARLVAGSLSFALATTPDHHLAATTTVTDPILCALTASLPDGTLWNPPELFSLKVLKDQPPVVRLLQPTRTRTEIFPAAPTAVLVEASVTDDYAVAEAHLVATVAKGSGEAVKFREQVIPFDAGARVAEADTPRARLFTKALDLAALGLEPGDELYFFVEAYDHRQPVANRARSETRFLTLRGPEEKKITTGHGLAGVNLIPAYFRSERQLILDTEKLLADRPALPDAVFRARANDLGVDQSILRLRYGRFLGEDQEESPLTDHVETNLDPLQSRVPATAPGPRAAASIAQRFAQEHLAQDREGGGDETAPRTPADGSPLTAAQIRQPFVDSHDDHDKNTFFDHETKGTMRDALTAMWEAEGALRTARPQEALVPEHRALDILKDLQQSVRAYVQHVGFDAPPLKVAERRLRGEAAGVAPRTTSAETRPLANPESDGVRTALAALSKTGALSSETLDALEPALVSAATRQPDEFLTGLQALRRLRAGGADTALEQSALQRTLLRLLPAAYPLPARVVDPAPALAAGYLLQLKPGGNDP